MAHLNFLIVAGIRLPLPFTTQMTVVRLSNGDLFLHSPIKFDEGLAKELHGLGKVRHKAATGVAGLDDILAGGLAT